MLPSYMLSFLSARLLFLKQGFTAKHPGAWLVWEPGRWAVPGKGGDVTATVNGAPSAGSAAATDALCFELKWKDPRTQVRVGRAADNDVVINDATLSRNHLLLTGVAEGSWLAEPAGADRPLLVNGRPAPPSAPIPLRSGDQLELRAVRLTFYDAAGFALRLASSHGATSSA